MTSSDAFTLSIQRLCPKSRYSFLDSSDNDHKKFGDLIIWRQLIDKAIEEKKGVVFINDDKKEDWWTIFKGKTIGPRPELVKEFHEKTKKRFYMYQADRFLEFASKHFKQEVKPESVDEIRDLRQMDVSNLRRLSRQRERLLAEKREAQERLEYVRSKLAMVNKKRHELEHWQSLSLEGFSPEGQIDARDLERHIDILKKSERLSGELERMELELQAAEMEYARAQQRLFEEEERHRTKR